MIYLFMMFVVGLLIYLIFLVKESANEMASMRHLLLFRQETAKTEPHRPAPMPTPIPMQRPEPVKAAVIPDPIPPVVQQPEQKPPEPPKRPPDSPTLVVETSKGPGRPQKGYGVKRRVLEELRLQRDEALKKKQSQQASSGNTP